MSLIIDIKVIPSSGRAVLNIDKAGNIKAYLKSPPEGGKANAELIKLISKELSCEQNEIILLLGATSRKKRIKIDLPLTHEQLLTKLGLAVQTSLIKT